MAESVVIYEKHEPHTAVIRLNRPEKKNAINRDVYWGLENAWQEAKADDDVWTIILTGSGDSWCAGGDLKENLAAARGEIKGPRFGPRPYPNLRELELNKPIIAAINGFAVGVALAWPLTAIFAIAFPQQSLVVLRCVGLTWPPGPHTRILCHPVGPFGLA